jgi:glutamyl-tRNA(Gln) amidotransferase subunit D
MSTSRRDAFRPINEAPIAKVYADDKGIEVINTKYLKKNDAAFKADTRHEKDVAMIFIHPGMNPKVIDFHIKEGVKGIVLMATALGHVPTLDKEKSLLPYLKRCQEENIPVIIATQTIYGRVHPLVYTNLRKLSIGHDVIFAEDMLAETAYVKLGWVLGHTKDLSKVKEMMLTNYTYEINERIDKESFLR